MQLETVSAESMSSAYTLIPVCQDPDVSPGETLIVDLYISGIGDLDKNKLYINFANENLADKADPGEIKIGIGPQMIEERLVPTFLDPEDLPSDNIYSVDGFGAIIGLPSWITSIANQRDSGPKRLGDEDYEEIELQDPEVYDPILTETRDGIPPIRLELNIDSNAKPGDYTLVFVLVYDSGFMNKKYFDRREVQIHVNTLRERWEPYPTGFAVAGAVAAVLSLIIQSGFFEWLYNISSSLIN